jgi:flagellar hook assembly protein FlgD
MTVPTGAPIVAGVEAKAPFPNPSRAGTTFEFTLKYPERVDLAVYDVRGRLVRRVVDGPAEAGANQFEWDGRDEHGALVPAGTYFFRLRAAGIAYSRPITILR